MRNTVRLKHIEGIFTHMDINNNKNLFAISRG